MNYYFYSQIVILFNIEKKNSNIYFFGKLKNMNNIGPFAN